MAASLYILSLQQFASQTLQWPCNLENCHHSSAGNAVDGNISTCTLTRSINPNGPDHKVWWYVDLGSVLSIYSVWIQFKDYKDYGEYIQRQRGRFAGFSLYISNTTKIGDGYLCYKNGYEPPPLNFTTFCIKHGRYIIYYNERLAGLSYPPGYELISYTQLCEVVVQGCKARGIYSSNCSLPCPKNCQEHRCDIINGSCLGCRPGWMGTFCNKRCENGFYGIECASSCSFNCADNQPCNSVDGKCENGCIAGWGGNKCDQTCTNGTYGANCSSNCSGNCLYKACNLVTGECENGCIPGYTGFLCSKECPKGFYGTSCSKVCSPYCNGDCEHVTGFCKSGCKAGYQGISCDKICASGTFGKHCEQNCSGNCIESETCNHVTGICDNGCADGYNGQLCNSACPVGHFGKNCSSVCSPKCINTCNHVGGSCDCTPGWKGTPNCSEECPSGFFGINCINKCSKHCAFNDTCNKVSGSCPRGCQGPYGGYLCQCKSVVSNKVQIDAINNLTAGMFFSIGLNVLMICAVLLLVRIICQKRSTETSQTVDDKELCRFDENTCQQYQELGIVDQSSSYQELPPLENQSVYQNYSL